MWVVLNAPRLVCIFSIRDIEFYRYIGEMNRMCVLFSKHTPPGVLGQGGCLFFLFRAEGLYAYRLNV